jgi:serine/threonine protein kinase
VTWQRDQQAHLLCWCHPNVVKSFDQFVSPEGYLVLVTELACGSLHQLVMERGSLTYLRICRLGVDIAGALHHVHCQNLIHRDVTLKNILWFNDGAFKLNDFGICKNCVAGSGIARTIIGLPSFMPPELVTSEFSVVKSDIYQLGMVLLTALTGKYPIPLDVTSHEAHRMVREGLPRQIAESLIQQCGPIAQLIAMMLRRSLDYRLACAADVRNAFLHHAQVIEGGGWPGRRVAWGGCSELPRAQSGIDCARS